MTPDGNGEYFKIVIEFGSPGIDYSPGINDECTIYMGRQLVLCDSLNSQTEASRNVSYNQSTSTLMVKPSSNDGVYSGNYSIVHIKYPYESDSCNIVNATKAPKIFTHALFWTV